MRGSEWRLECLWLRGHRCRVCGETGDIQMDHIIPRSQGGKNDPENGLPLCGPWSTRSPYPNGCHQAKTERRLLLKMEWLDKDQIEYLAEKGWVTFDDDGQPTGGRGCRGFRGGSARSADRHAEDVVHGDERRVRGERLRPGGPGEVRGLGVRTQGRSGVDREGRERA